MLLAAHAAARSGSRPAASNAAPSRSFSSANAAPASNAASNAALQFVVRGGTVRKPLGHVQRPAAPLVGLQVLDATATGHPEQPPLSRPSGCRPAAGVRAWAPGRCRPPTPLPATACTSGADGRLCRSARRPAGAKEARHALGDQLRPVLRRPARPARSTGPRSTGSTTSSASPCVPSSAGPTASRRSSGSATPRRTWLRRFLALPNGIPSHDTFDRVLRPARPARRSPSAFGRWMAGGCARRPGCGPSPSTARRCGRPRATRSAGACTWSARGRPRTGLILGQEAVADGSHEIAAIPELLKALDLKGAMVTHRRGRLPDGDRPADPRRRAATTCWRSRGTSRRCSGRSRRRSTGRARPTSPRCVRRARVGGGRARAARGAVRDGDLRPRGAAARVAGRGGGGRGRPGARGEGGANASTAHYYITSLRGRRAEAGRLRPGPLGHRERAALVPRRGFREDANRTRDANAGANLGVVRRVAASLLKQDPGEGQHQGQAAECRPRTRLPEQVLRGFKAN